MASPSEGSTLGRAAPSPPRNSVQMPSAHFLTVDVFTDRAFGGNQLAVFPDAHAIPEELLLPITR